MNYDQETGHCVMGYLFSEPMPKVKLTRRRRLIAWVRSQRHRLCCGRCGDLYDEH